MFFKKNKRIFSFGFVFVSDFRFGGAVLRNSRLRNCATSFRFPFAMNCWNQLVDCVNGMTCCQQATTDGVGVAAATATARAASDQGETNALLKDGRKRPTIRLSNLEQRDRRRQAPSPTWADLSVPMGSFNFRRKSSSALPKSPVNLSRDPPMTSKVCTSVLTTYLLHYVNRNLSTIRKHLLT